MKWTKRIAALLVALLLLSISAYGRESNKSSSRAEQTLSLTQANITEESNSQEMPELPVLQIEVEPFVPETQAKDEKQAAPSTQSASPAPSELRTQTETFALETQAAEVKPSVPSTQSAALMSDANLTPAATPNFPEAEDWQLLLANPWNEIPEDYQVTLKTLPGGLKIDEKAYDSLTAMLQACRNAGLNPMICSAYRTQAKQTSLYNNKIARLRNAGYSKQAAIKEAGRWVARPGTSEHQLGLAVDLVSTSYQALTKKQENTKEQKWLMEHCWEYGFILRYPNDKSAITGIGYEPWHYRYVGVDVAQDVRASGLCFEEYLLLRERTLAAQTAEQP